ASRRVRSRFPAAQCRNRYTTSAAALILTILSSLQRIAQIRADYKIAILALAGLRPSARADDIQAITTSGATVRCLRKNSAVRRRPLLYVDVLVFVRVAASGARPHIIGAAAAPQKVNKCHRLWSIQRRIALIVFPPRLCSGARACSTPKST